MKHTALRIKTLTCIILVLWIVIEFRLYTLQIKENPSFQILANKQQSYTNSVSAPRGIIKSSDGIELAINTPSYNVFVYTPNIINTSKFTAKALPLLGFSSDTFNTEVANGIKYFQVGWGLTPAQKGLLASKLSVQDFQSLQFILTETRVYPNHSLLAQVLGYVNRTTQMGEYGIEGYYNGDLLGVPGNISGDEDPAGAPIINPNFSFIPPSPGENITLTVNAYIQQMVESKLKTWVDTQNADSGTVIIMNPKTGAIIAMANYPTFDPNTYFNGYSIDCNDYMLATMDVCKGKSKTLDDTTIAQSFNNPAISLLYEPGSVLKAITASAALEEGKITPATKFHDTTGVYEASGYKVYNYNKQPDGVMTMGDILKLSSNVGASMVAKLLGTDILYKYYKAFGIGTLTGITLQGEETALLPQSSSWHAIDLATASFGQFVSATPLQVISVYQTIANNGVRMKPYIVQSVQKKGNENINYKPQELGKVISSQTAQEVTTMLQEATTGEPVYGIRLSGLQPYASMIASKTGTAQVPLPNKAGYYNNIINASYVGYAPANNPKFVMLTMLKSPRNSLYAATSAVPLWTDIAKDLFLYYKLPPQ